MSVILFTQYDDDNFHSCTFHLRSFVFRAFLIHSSECSPCRAAMFH